MKPLVYAVIFLLIIPFQASLLDPFALGSVKPDLALALLFLIGLLTGPAEATFAGMAVGVIQDIGSASLIGFSGLTRGLVGLSAGLLGTRVLDIGSPLIVLFLGIFSLAEGIIMTLFLQVTYGDVPFFRLFAVRLLPQAIYTALLGLLVLHFVGKKDVLARLMRHGVQKEK